MESQNYLTIAIEKMGHVMLDDRHMKASDIYKTAVKLHKKEDYNPPSYNEDKFKVRSVFEKGGLCFYVMPKDGRATEFFMYIHGGENRLWGGGSDIPACAGAFGDRGTGYAYGCV